MNKRTINIIIAVLLILNAWTWHDVYSYSNHENAVYFLDVGQGDSQLITLTSSKSKTPIRIMIDGGKDKRVLSSLDTAIGKSPKRIDLLIMTHPHLDHYGGFVEVVKRYDVGMFISNGQTTDDSAFHALMSELDSRNIKSITLLEGDSIFYNDIKLSIISPDKKPLQSDDKNEESLVIVMQGEIEQEKQNIFLFTGDIGFPTENALLSKKIDIESTVLKVGHHGSKNSSGDNFIAKVRPAVAVIGVGRNNHGHPAKSVLDTLMSAGAEIYRTDLDGTVKISLEEEVKSSNMLSNLSSNILASLYRIPPNNKITELSLPELIKSANPDRGLVPYSMCSFDSLALSASPTSSKSVTINEIAWMGQESGATHEWIEMKNISGEAIDMSGWQLINKNERIRITFPQNFISDPNEFIVLSRGKSIIPNLEPDIIFTGAIRNTNEGLRLFNNECELIDQVFASPSWPAGDNKLKLTMERARDNLSWISSSSPGGTPGKENSTGYIELKKETEQTAQTEQIETKQTEKKLKTYLPADVEECESGQININTSSKDELTKIRHIGPARAEAIIKNRPFSSIYELKEKVSGIGDGRLKDILEEGITCVK